MIAASHGYNSSVTIDAEPRRRHQAQRDGAERGRPGRHGHLGGRARHRPCCSPRTRRPRWACGWLGTGQIGAVTGTGRSRPGPALLRLQVFDAGAVLQPGQQVVTFGSVHGRPYVPGVPVGVITQVQASATSLTKLALVRPYADDSALGVVGVVIVPPRTNPRDSVLPPRLSHARPRLPPARAPCLPAGRPARPRRPAPGAEVRRVTFALAAILAAVVLQTALLDRLPFPGGSAPNLVLVLVVTLALASGPHGGHADRIRRRAGAGCGAARQQPAGAERAGVLRDRLRLRAAARAAGALGLAAAGRGRARRRRRRGPVCAG